MYTLKFALRPWRRMLPQQMGVVLSVTLLLFLMATLFVFSQVIDVLVTRAGTQSKTLIFFEKESGVSVDRIQSLVGSSVVREVDAKSTELADLDIAPRVFEIEGNVTDETLQLIREKDVYLDVDRSAERYAPLVEQMQTIRSLFKGLFVVLGLTLLTFLGLLNRLNHGLFSESAQVIRSLGGSSWQQRFPELVYLLTLFSLPGFISFYLVQTLRPLMLWGLKFGILQNLFQPEGRLFQIDFWMLQGWAVAMGGVVIVAMAIHLISSRRVIYHESENRS